MSPLSTAQSCVRTPQCEPTRWCSPPAPPTSRRSSQTTPASTRSSCSRTSGAGRCSASWTSCTRARQACPSPNWLVLSRLLSPSRCEVWPPTTSCHQAWVYPQSDPARWCRTATASVATPHLRHPVTRGNQVTSCPTSPASHTRTSRARWAWPTRTTVAPARCRDGSRQDPGGDLGTASTRAWTCRRLEALHSRTLSHPTANTRTGRRTWASGGATVPDTPHLQSTWWRWSNLLRTARGGWKTTSATGALSVTGTATANHTTRATWEDQRYPMESTIYKSRYNRG